MNTKTKLTALTLAAAVVLAFAPGASAADKPKAKDEGPPPAVGEVVSIIKDAIHIKDHLGMAHTFVINAETKYGTASEPQKFSDLAKGDHVAISYVKDEGEKTVAKVIRELPAHTRPHGPPPVAGEILSISHEAIHLREHDGKEHTYVIHADTKYGSKAEPQKFSDLEKGDQVLILYAKDEGDKTVANTIVEVPHAAKDKGPPPSAGEILNLSADSIHIKEHDGKEHVYVIDAATKYGSKTKPEEFSDLQEGDYVMIRYAKEEGNKTVAKVIHDLIGHGHGPLE